MCFISACRYGQKLLGEHMHPEIVLSAIPMAASMPGWESNTFTSVAEHLRRGVEQVAAAGADFFICPDNTAHIVLESIVESLPIPGLHIAHVVASEMTTIGGKVAGLLGTKWTMSGNVYPKALSIYGLEVVTPNQSCQAEINRAIFEELCLGNFLKSTTDTFVQAIRELKEHGADCVILGCTEIPLIINSDNSPLPVLDSTRLLAEYAVREAMRTESPRSRNGWITE